MEFLQVVTICAKIFFINLLISYIALAQVGAPCDEDEKLFNYQDCSTYFYCSIQVDNTKTWTLTPCPEGQIFLPEGKDCEYGDPSQCKPVNPPCPDIYPEEETEFEQRVNGPNTLKPVGTTTGDGKTFYYADLPRRVGYLEIFKTLTWFDVVDYCERWNQTIAKIETEEENEVLHNAWGKAIPNSYYWTSGRDSRALREFVWDDNEEQVEMIIPYINEVTEHQSCLVYYDNSLRSGECWGTFGTLCEDKAGVHPSTPSTGATSKEDSGLAVVQQGKPKKMKKQGEPKEMKKQGETSGINSMLSFFG